MRRRANTVVQGAWSQDILRKTCLATWVAVELLLCALYSKDCGLILQLH
jgi:hypothetical protein